MTGDAGDASDVCHTGHIGDPCSPLRATAQPAKVGCVGGADEVDGVDGADGSHRTAWSGRAAWVGWAGWAGCALLFALAPWLLGEGLAIQLGIALIAMLGMHLLLGEGGIVHFGYAVYTGAGAFVAIHALRAIEPGAAWPVSLVPLFSGLVVAVLAWPLGWLSTRGTPLTGAMMTFGMGELLWAFAPAFPGFFGGEGGVGANRVTGLAPWGVTLGPQVELYGVVAIYAFVATWVVWALARTPWGYTLRAVRDNPRRADFLGCNPHAVRWRAFVGASLLAGVSGGLAALHFERVTTDSLGTPRSAAFLLFAVLGGSRTIAGPVWAAVLMVLAFVVLSAWTPAWLLYVGLLFVATVLYAPGGIDAWVAQCSKVAGLPGAVPWLLACAAGALLCAMGFVAMVEMAYHLQSVALYGPVVQVMGMALDVRDADCWVGAVWVGAVGAGTLALCARRGGAR